MENSAENVSIAEKKWLKLLFNYSKGKFTLFPLPSHDHFHHLRVWKYAKTILLNLDENGIQYSPEDTETLLIAVLFHDMGMITTREKEHGNESQKLCREFFSLHPSLEPESLSTILEMIEDHDNKEYSKIISVHNRPSLRAILNISDDLDAFGNIGVYRYIEIYHFRGIPANELSNRILPNLEARFDHFTQVLGQLEGFMQIHKKRYKRTRNFFLRLENEFKNPSSIPGSKRRIVKILIDFSNGLDPDIHSLLSIVNRSKLDLQGKKFFHELMDEWDELTFNDLVI